LFFVIATVVSCLLAAPLAFLGVECWLSMLPLCRHRLNTQDGPILVAVVIPANNEEERIAATVRGIKAQVGDGTNVIVVADNCDDATADRACEAGATVWIRRDAEHRGKGYALNYVVERLSESPPDVVIFVDADCTTGPDCIETLARLANQYQRPIQSAYTMRALESAEDLSNTSALAVYVKNVARPRGLQRIGLPCMLNGSGMAFPWEALKAVPFPDQHITEDMRMSGDLAKIGLAPIPCMEVFVTSELPTHRAGFMVQRTRWEHGHLATMFRVMPGLLLAFIRRPSVQVLGILLELSVPPLSLMIANAAVCTLVLAGLSYASGSWLPLAIYLVVGAVAACGVLTVWLSQARDILSPRKAMQIPRYALAKAPMYLRFVTRRQRTWVRTDRPLAATGERVDRGTLSATSTPSRHTDDRG
jgi:cellulose synthase/poly-beta-1,6-N-acetylglucosamine synthase-like glycosyltransferase